MPLAPRNTISHWHHLVEEFQTSATDFYAAVRAAVERREAPDIGFSEVEWNEKGILSAKRTYLRVKRGRISFDICAAPYGRGTFFSWWVAETPSYSALGYLVLLITGLGFLSFLLLTMGGNNLNAACGVFVMIALLWLAGLPFGIFLLGSAVHNGAIGDETAVMATPVLGAIYVMFWNPYSYYRLDTAIMFQETVSRAVGEVLNETLSGQGLRTLSETELRPLFARFGRNAS